MTLIPPVPRSREDIARIRSRVVEEAQALLTQDLHLGQPEKDIGHTDFYLAYHGLDDRPLKELLARMYLHAYPALRFVSAHLAEVVARRDGKLRIGVVCEDVVYLYSSRPILVEIFYTRTPFCPHKVYKYLF